MCKHLHMDIFIALRILCRLPWYLPIYRELEKFHPVKNKPVPWQVLHHFRIAGGHCNVLARGGKQGRLCRGEHTSHTSSSTVPRYLTWSLLSWASGSLLLGCEKSGLSDMGILHWSDFDPESQQKAHEDWIPHFTSWSEQYFYPLYPFSANSFLFLLEHNELFLSNFAGLPRIGLEICSYLIHVAVCLYYLMQTRTLLSSASYWSQQVTYTEGGNTWFISPQSPFPRTQHLK